MEIIPTTLFYALNVYLKKMVSIALNTTVKPTTEMGLFFECSECELDCLVERSNKECANEKVEWQNTEDGCEN